jgi:hypothetical protein
MSTRRRSSPVCARARHSARHLRHKVSKFPYERTPMCGAAETTMTFTIEPDGFVYRLSCITGLSLWHLDRIGVTGFEYGSRIWLDVVLILAAYHTSLPGRIAKAGMESVSSCLYWTEPSRSLLYLRSTCCGPFPYLAAFMESSHRA